MNVYPIGNNLTVKWTLRYSDGTVFPLSLYDYELCYRTSRGVKVATDTTVEDNVLRWILKADDQVVSGPYSLALKITLAGNKAVDLQYNNAFALTFLCHGNGANVEVRIESNCDVIDLKDAVLQSRKAMDLAAGAVKTSAESAKAAAAAQAAAEKVAGEFKNTAQEAQKAAQEAQQSAQEATANAQKAQASAATASEHITSLNKAIAELPDGQAVSEKVAEHTVKLTKIDQLMQEGYTFMGMATLEMDPGTPDQKVFYIAYGKGHYTNFGGRNVDENEIGLFYYDDAWRGEFINLGGIGYGECETAADNPNKEVTINNIENVSRFVVFFKYGNTADNVTLSVNGEEKKILFINTPNHNPFYVPASKTNSWNAGELMDIVKLSDASYLAFNSLNSRGVNRRVSLYQFGTSGYIDGNGINQSNYYRYAQLRLLKGETVVLYTICHPEIYPISTIENGVFKPLAQSTSGSDYTTFIYTAKEDESIYVCGNLSTEQTSSSVISNYVIVDTRASLSHINKAFEDSYLLNNIDITNSGSDGYIKFASGEFTSAVRYKNIDIPIKAGYTVKVEALCDEDTAVISVKDNNSYLPKVSGTEHNFVENFYYSATKDSLLTISYDSASPAKVSIYKTQRVRTKWFKELNVGNVPYLYECKQTNFADFPNKENTKYNEVIAKFDTIVDARLTSEEIGESSDGQKIKAYHYKPYTAIYDYQSDSPDSRRMVANAKPLPLVVIIAGQHGFEKCNVLGLYYFLRDLIYGNSEALSYYRSMVEFVIIPVANPSGFDVSTYKNSNGVNLNRNWGTEPWNTSKDTQSAQYGGEAPFDQPETLAIKTYLSQYLDRCNLLLDSHTNGSTNITQSRDINWIDLEYVERNDEFSNKLLNAAVAHSSKLTELFIREFSDLIPQKNMCSHPNVSVSYDKGNCDVYFEQQGLLAVTLEGFNGFQVGETYSENVLKANAEIVGNFILSVLDEYGK